MAFLTATVRTEFLARQQQREVSGRRTGPAGYLLVENNAASHPLDEAVSAGQNYRYILANGLPQIVGYRVGPDGSLTRVATAPVMAGPGGLGAS